MKQSMEMLRRSGIKCYINYIMSNVIISLTKFFIGLVMFDSCEINVFLNILHKKRQRAHYFFFNLKDYFNLPILGLLNQQYLLLISETKTTVYIYRITKLRHATQAFLLVPSYICSIRISSNCGFWENSPSEFLPDFHI